jgi:hypothetical protein
MQYVFVAYIYDLNVILVHTMPSKNNGAMVAAFTDVLANLGARDYVPTLNNTIHSITIMPIVPTPLLGSSSPSPQEWTHHPMLKYPPE